MEEYFKVGIITSTHGLKGEVKVFRWFAAMLGFFAAFAIASAVSVFHFLKMNSTMNPP